MLAWAEKAPEVVKTGILDRAEYEAWDGSTQPQSYCGGIWGRDVVQINDNSFAHLTRDKAPRMIDDFLRRIQCDLFELGAQLATAGDAAERITAGCAASPPRYCPLAEVQRSEISLFLARLLRAVPLP